MVSGETGRDLIILLWSPRSIFTYDIFLRTDTRWNMQGVLDICWSFATEFRLEFSPAKLMVLVRNAPPEGVPLTLQDVAIGKGSEVEYLGVTLTVHDLPTAT